MKKISFIFDIGNVMINFDLEHFISVISKETNKSVEQILENWNNEKLLAIETGKLNNEDFFRYYKATIGLQWDKDRWITEYADTYSINTLGENLFLELKDKGFPVYILSNLAEYNKLAIDKKYPDFFKPSTYNFFSYELGFHKPDAKIYQKVCEHINQPPESCVFIDDSPVNVKGAEAIGMHGIHFTEDIESINKQISDIIISKRDM